MSRLDTLIFNTQFSYKELTFDIKTLKINGFTNLGDYTPKHQKNEKGDHALVMMFQPFRGNWVQSIACFLSKGCASSTVLQHLIIESVILLEKSGFNVDVITTDGASWNRSMWNKFNISEDKLSCQHPYNENRQLWFCSDFPHLVKNFRNFIVKKPETWTPDGIVKLVHWSAVIEMDRPKGLNLKMCPKLSQDDIHPKGYQMMNVGRAYRLFSKKTETAMKIYKDENCANLIDCEPTVTLINKLSLLISIMSSRTPIDALKPDSAETNFLLQFVEYLKNWQKSAATRGYYFLSANTLQGLIITLKATVEILSFLNTCHYKYLMTSRLNQDTLERFFGMMRGACGANEHPDSNLFVQIFKLISTYSLIKPPRGCNVDSDEIFSCLLNADEIECSSDENLAQFQKNLDRVMDNCIWFNDMPFDESFEHEHDYNFQTSSNFVVSYVAGYMARKCHRFTKCNNCLLNLKSNEPKGRDKFITLLSKGYLTYPSDPLFLLIRNLECAFLEVVSSRPIHKNIILEVAHNMEYSNFNLVGCAVHAPDLTEVVIRFFITTRMFFLCKTVNELEKLKKEKTRQLRKQSKL